MKLYIIAGHGNGDPGACAGGYTEAALVRKLAKRIKTLGGADVTVLDTTRNWYADGGISRLDLPKDAQILELHLDSAVASAKGGHVIIDENLSADKYDKALAAFIGEMFPGRAKTLVKRNDLANANRAQARGFSYRLLENCFISNKADRTKFISQTDKLAKGILKAFDIEEKKAATAKEKDDPFTYKVRVTAKTLNVRTGAGASFAIVKQGGKNLVLKKGEVYTIVQTKLVNGKKWGKLKSGAGWIHLGYTEKV